MKKIYNNQKFFKKKGKSIFSETLNNINLEILSILTKWVYKIVFTH